MSVQPKFWDTADATSSPASEDGSTHSDSPDGEMTGRSGRRHSPANPSPSPDSEKRKPTLVTCGQPSESLFQDASLQSFLENRFRQVMDLNGSTEYVLTWKAWVMSSGRPIFALRASARPTSGNAFSGWPTPVANDDNKTPEAHLAMKERMGGNRTAITSLQVIAQTTLSGYPSPSGRDWKDTPGMATEGVNPDGSHRDRMTGHLPRVAHLAGWSTPTHTDGDRGSLPPREWDTGVALSQMAPLAGYPTPTVPNGGRRQKLGSMSNTGQLPDGSKRQVDLDYIARGATTESSLSSPAKRGALNAALSRWLMGYPARWDVAAIIAHRRLKQKAATPRRPESAVSEDTETQ